LYKRGVAINLNLDLALGQFISALGKEGRRFSLRAYRCRHNVAELDNDRLLGISAHGHNGGSDANQQCGKFHVFSS
jgi:coproporphyrinogen III oxidase-like Fe-S oxidoreductase